MANDGKPEEVVFYHGSLEELNSRDSTKQYRFADRPSYVSSPCGLDYIVKVSEELRKCGFDGLVNRRTIMMYTHEEVTPLIVYLEGTPIIRFPR